MKKLVSVALVSQIEPKRSNEALSDESWMKAMQELDQFERHQVWTLIKRPKNVFVIGTKWVFRNKLNEEGKVIRNETRLVAQGYSQQEGIDYDKTFASVARLESLRILLAYVSFKRFKVFQMDVKSVFLNDFIKEEVFVKQPPGFENPSCPDYVFRLTKLDMVLNRPLKPGKKG